MTTTASEMLDTYPADLGGVDRMKLADCIKECFACAQSCTACADACLSESDVASLVKCIRTNLDCADICFATGQVLSRHTGYDANITRAMLHACMMACKSCGDLCEEHSAMMHCAKCAMECRACEQACSELLDSLDLRTEDGREDSGAAVRQPQMGAGGGTCSSVWTLTRSAIRSTTRRPRLGARRD